MKRKKEKPFCENRWGGGTFGGIIGDENQRWRDLKCFLRTFFQFWTVKMEIQPFEADRLKNGGLKL
jgi:hypothetical protein